MINIGFDKKLYLGSIGIILLTILIIAAMNFYQSKQSFLAKGETSIQNVSDVLLKTVQLKYNLQVEKLEADLSALAAESVSGNKQAMFVQDQDIEMELIDADTKKKSTAMIPRLVFGVEFVTGDFGMVDKVGKTSTTDMAFYQLFDGKLVKVSTNKTDKAGKRLVGEYLSSDSEIYKAVTAGKKVSVLTKKGLERSMQILVPFTEFLENKVAGAYSVTSTILTSDLIDLVKKVNVGGFGYTFVSNGKGDILVHKDKEFLSMNVADFGNGKKMLTQKSGPAIFQYKNKTYRAYVNYFKAWDLYFTVAVSEDELMTGVNKQIATSAGLSGIIALIIGIIIIGLMNRQIVKNMNGMATLAKEVAKGNFKYSFTYTAKDAIKDTVDSMNQMVEGLAHMVKELNSGVKTLSDASGELNQVSDKMSETSETSVAKVNTVASAAEEMSVNMDSVAAAMEQASTNVEVVATGTNDMSSSIEKVSQNSNKTREITNKAVEKAQQTSSRVSELGRAAEEINKVTDTINSISSQTNLLALNATIEAARAGEAGKGFAVVANEIKELAGQTAGATEDIAKNIQEIQDQISGAVKEIQEISEIINQIDSYVNEAAIAIESQSATTNEIAENINQVSLGIQEVNVNVNQSSEVSGEVAKDISDVLAASQEINAFSTTVKEKAGMLNNVMKQLQALTEKFKI